MEPSKLRNVIMAILFASEEPVSTRRLCAIIEDAKADDVHAAVDDIREILKTDMPSIVMEEIGGGLQLSTNPEFAEYVARIYSGKRKQRLSRAAMETVAIIAYKQPITRADIEIVRGVSAGGVVTTLMERGLIRITGKAKILGAPFLYGTTPEFLEYLGLNSLKDLPTMEELEKMLEREEENVDESGASKDAVVAEAVADDAPEAEEQAASNEETSEEEPLPWESPAEEDSVATDAADEPVDDATSPDTEPEQPVPGEQFGRVEGDTDDKLLGAGKDVSDAREPGAEFEVPAEAEEVAGDELEKQIQAEDNS